MSSAGRCRLSSASSSSSSGLLLLVAAACLTPSVTCLRSPSRVTRAAPYNSFVAAPLSPNHHHHQQRVTRAASTAQIDGDQPTTFTLDSPISEEEAVELRLFGFRLADVSGVSVELRRDDASRSHRRLKSVPSRGGGFLSELRWSVCGAAGVDTVLVRVHWKAESDPAGRRIHCQVASKNVLLRDGGDWGVRLGAVEFRRLPWPPGTPENGPATVEIRSTEVTAAVVCLKLQCLDDDLIDSLSAADDVTCQDFTDCAIFDIEQGRPSFLYVRPRAAASHQISKPVVVRFGAGRHPPEWTTTAAAVAAAAPPASNANATETCRRRRLDPPGQDLPGQDPPPRQEGGSRTKITPVKVLVKTSVTVYRQQQPPAGQQQTKQQTMTTGQQPQQPGQQQQQTRISGQQETEAAGGDGGDGASSGGSDLAPSPAALLLALGAAVALLLGQM